MKKLLVALVMFAAGYSLVAQAQTQSQPQTSARSQAAVESKAPLDDHYNACMSNKDCSTQVRLQIIQEENDEMNNKFQKIHQVCADANFQDCIDKQKDNVDAWYSAQNKMQKLMQSMQTQDLNDKEPSAGGPSSSDDAGKKSFWEKNMALRRE